MQSSNLKVIAGLTTVSLAAILIACLFSRPGPTQAPVDRPVIASITETATKAPYQWQVKRVLDGDTVEVDAKFFPAELGNIEIRVRGVDTPEKAPRSKCDSEAQLAKKATQFAKDNLLGKTITVTSVGQDKYGGRVVAVVTVDGKVYGDLLIANGLAKPYFGKTKQSWCN